MAVDRIQPLTTSCVTFVEKYRRFLLKLSLLCLHATIHDKAGYSYGQCPFGWPTATLRVILRARTPCTHAMHARPACTPCTHSHVRHVRTAMYAMYAQPCTPCTHSHARHVRTAMHAQPPSIIAHMCTRANRNKGGAYLPMRCISPAGWRIPRNSAVECVGRCVEVGISEQLAGWRYLAIVQNPTSCLTNIGVIPLHPGIEMEHACMSSQRMNGDGCGAAVHAPLPSGQTTSGGREMQVVACMLVTASINVRTLVRN